MIKELVVATRNKKKLEEIKYMLKDLNFMITSLADYDNLPKIIEDGLTFKENAIKKSATIAQYLGKFTLGEDSGLEVEALGNRPGVYSARYSGKNSTDRRNNQKLLKELAKVPLKKRKAKYTCSVAVCDSHGLLGVFEGTCRGIIASRERGQFGFGYDPIFLIPKYNKTFGELGEGIKHKMSHRYKAFVKVRNFILGLDRQRLNPQHL
ncbi:MAG: RdgB/HAM1 family non-canonical purine NTP pyrophosphatase [Candidatus Omnitrophica bacterium]|nr:RdgB/HAM1 family non-canonical purine NTP pyrophosphatase [Candidatus Omnitrophota bacterium]MDD5352018.1 RdgB/HAM1 family non-canonical purine NTP pyrophosphatase [Candidatus Omnitrophota bacterium]MDD5551072.1 RdgB/HAM1 family non-canonical purine NTP pyrophosphatase [Candidatus Omnitrophota bacterium]